MKSVILPAYNKNIIRAMLSLKVEEIERPKPKNEEVLIKVHASPVNPSDIAFIQGSYNIVKSLPAIPGFEASGIIEDAAPDQKHLIGKKVSCFVQDDKGGTWSNYVVANIQDIILLKDDMDMDQAACFTVNPLTAYGLMEIALQYNASAIIQNASGGQVASFIRKMATISGIEVIDIVRKKETAEQLSAEGAKHVLVDTDDDFLNRLADISKKLLPTVAFDAVGGTLGAHMFNALSNDSELVVYGGLSGKQLSELNVMDIIFENKIISGFNLIDWKAEIGIEEFNKAAEELQDLFIDGTLSTKISSSTSLENIVKGLRGYIANMSGGKLLVKP